MNRHTLTIAIMLLLTAEFSGCTRPARGPVLSDGVGSPVEQKFLVNVDENGVALQGYDPVAYFTQKKPVRGESRFRSAYRGAIYHFASAEHKSMFDREPARYEPQFGGFCGYAASINKVSPISVEFWEVLDGRLVLQHNQKAWNLWHQDVPGNLKKADANWSGLVERYGL
ncbi:MAG: YHS domain-containing protein [Phycisphaerae bacterium]|nr:YHS domain-containing protein [Phycisphaerae bacterium]NUQ45414.1 YHS domain-containing protein [Phycisphaerae bacterium]